MDKIKFTTEELDKYMDTCISLAKCSPFPMGRPYVGAMILNEEGNILSNGYKTFLSGTNMILHAERNAIYNSNISPMSKHSRRSHILITTLEPCSQTRRTQQFCSCSELILQYPISTVVIGDFDDVSFSNGKPSSFLSSRGITVIPHLNLRERIKDELINPLYGYDSGKVYTPAKTLYKMSRDN
ncbi:hypothetical protein FJZ18_00725 [Candidatus Pacearchaeota archaeon]|nr:hypothetical protein [Candidatus Pacearchaeota archaeon]